MIRASPVFWFREGRAHLGAWQLSCAKSLRNPRFWKLVNRFHGVLGRSGESRSKHGQRNSGSRIRPSGSVTSPGATAAYA